MADEPDPPRKFYELKPKAFEQVNNIPSLPLAPGSLPPAQSERIDVRDLYRQANTPGRVLTPHRTPAAQNEVHAVLQDNHARANAAGLNTIVPKPRRRSRRTRDYYLVVIPADAFFGYAAFGPYSNVALMAYGVAGIILTTLGLAWIMFGVMDDY